MYNETNENTRRLNLEFGSTVITTRCPNEIRAWAKSNNVKIPRILWAGYKRLSGAERDPVEDLTKQIQTLSDKLQRTARRVYELEAGVENNGATK